MSDFEEYQRKLMGQVAAVFGLPKHLIERSKGFAFFDRSIVEIMAVTGRKYKPCHRGAHRLLRLAERKQLAYRVLYDEWRRRVVTGKWGQEARLNRIGIYYPVRL
ncbi:hypothetical protein PCC82_06495 [Agrobacterium deltaense]